MNEARAHGGVKGVEKGHFDWWPSQCGIARRNALHIKVCYMELGR